MGNSSTATRLEFPDKQTTAQTPALFNMRTSTQLLSGLGFLALLAPASAQSSSSIESSIESSFESSSTILPSSQSSSEIVSTTELSSTTGASSSSESSSTQTSSEVSSFTTPSSSLSTSFVPSSSTSESSLSSLSSFSSVASSSTTVNVTTSSTSSSTSSSATPTGSQSAPFFLTIQTAASKRRQPASGSYLAVVNGQLIATDACNVIPPTAFTIDADRLRAGDSFATATAAEIAAPGYSAVEFAAVAAAGDVQTVFAVDAVAGLSWTNAGFLNGAADFCLLNNVVQAAYTVPIASIADCVPVNLVSSQEVCETPVTNIIIGVEISIDITIINVVNVINGATVTYLHRDQDCHTPNDSYLRTSRDLLRRQQRNRLLHHHRCLRTMPVPRLRSRPAHRHRNQERLPSLRRFHSYPSHCDRYSMCHLPTSCPWYCHPDYWRQAIRIHCSCTSHNCRRCPRPADPSRHCNRCRRQPNIPSYLHWCSFFHQRQGCRLRYRCRSLPFALLVRHS